MQDRKATDIRSSDIHSWKFNRYSPEQKGTNTIDAHKLVEKAMQ